MYKITQSTVDEKTRGKKTLQQRFSTNSYYTTAHKDTHHSVKTPQEYIQEPDYRRQLLFTSSIRLSFDGGINRQ